MFYWVRADKMDEHREEHFYPGEEKQMYAWMQSYVQYGWRCTWELRNRNQGEQS